MKKAVGGGAWERSETCTNFGRKNLKGEKFLKDLVVDAKIKIL
jgi:hypothetical protein